MSHKCAWCHISPGTIIIHPTLQAPNQRFCENCHHDYLKMRPSLKCPSGIIPCCRLKDSGEKYFLFGLENSGWCHLQGRDDPSDKSIEMTACREGAEESCYAIGTPQQIMETYFFKGKYSQPGGWGAFVLDFGELSQTMMDHIVQRHKENLVKIKSLDRKPNSCESEMFELRWCKYSDFKKSVLKCVDKNNFIVEGFDSVNFRPWCLRYYKILVEDFKE